MFQHLLIFPSSADAAVVERIVTEDLAPHFRNSVGFRSLSISLGALMGPGAQDGGASVVVEATFESLDSALGAISAPDFEPTAATVESLGAVIYLFELRDV